ncbi:hypothetical protein WMF27_34195 [Sorangium sp. So ce281]|uniref:hypothetical protein n=1 Tax=unclassified Sorangium TaxID=2621164 RepID=UPI003F6450DF
MADVKRAAEEFKAEHDRRLPSSARPPGARVVSTSSSMQARGKFDLAKTPTSPEAASLKGEYISKRRPATPQKQAMDPKLAADLWTSSEKLGAEAAARAARGNA